MNIDIKTKPESVKFYKELMKTATIITELINQSFPIINPF